MIFEISILSILFMGVKFVLAENTFVQINSTTNEIYTKNAQNLDPLWYLNKFGYLDNKSLKINTKKSANLIMLPSNDSNNTSVQIALKKFQKYAGLNETGILDEDTLRIMKLPRCGHPDILENELLNSTRRRRYALQGSKWAKSKLFLKLVNILNTEL